MLSQVCRYIGVRKAKLTKSLRASSYSSFFGMVIVGTCTVSVYQITEFSLQLAGVKRKLTVIKPDCNSNTGSDKSAISGKAQIENLFDLAPLVLCVI